MVEKERRDHVAWHQIVRNMTADEAVAYISILWQCSHTKNIGRFVTSRSGLMMPSPSVSINPMSHPAQLKAYQHLFGEVESSPVELCTRLSSWIDRTVDVKFIELQAA